MTPETRALLKTTGDQIAAGLAAHHDEFAGKKPSGEPQEHILEHPGGDEYPKQAKKWTIDQMEEDPEGYFQAMLPESRKENPGMTDAQIRANWDAARYQFFGT